MKSISTLALCAAAALFSTTNAQTLPASLVGTWTTKSNKTFTGPGFYNPQKDEFIEPARTGFSYSFTADGFYEEAYYRAISNPTNPKCPSGILQFQHGSWIQNANGSLTLTPIAVDGRQLMSTPCNSNNAIYTRYNQTELFKTWQVYLDPYHQIQRLDLFGFDGAPLNPMYLAYQPPQMLPTTTLNPTATGTGAAKAATATSKSRKAKRAADLEVPLNWQFSGRKGAVVRTAMNPDWWWWTGLTFTGVGGLLYFGPRRMGIQL
ncbi:ROT1-like protein [Myriangium duriaei CBS 260.36]|uniref:Protein ROT1 n=1 Tax=Myriangium duriaei CBS 260.36 TaxID=1168546 RepID=A0A9P4MPV9_9PEZI|nr:ROT1-like protein [Myriangium duriaei CBS 260.36]